MEASVQERLAEAIALCRAGAALVETWPSDVRERALTYREALPPGAEATLRRLLVGP
jgi:hypothetical protein